MSRKGKSKTRIARRDILRANAKVAAMRARSYSRQAYDKPQGEES